MKDPRLNGLALMFVHNNIAIDRMDILRVWDSPGHRRIVLAFNSENTIQIDQNTGRSERGAIGTQGDRNTGRSIHTYIIKVNTRVPD